MKALVTGGGGFLGSAIVAKLRQRGGQVRSFSRQRYEHLAADVEQFSGDLTDVAALERAMVDRDIVFHVAAKTGVWGKTQDFYRTNVLGTQNVIAACRKRRISRLVYTSSPSVVFNGRDMEGVDESVEYPRHFEADYPRSKALAEHMVRSANDASLATVCLRPHLIWGPGDPHLVPRILERGRTGQLRRIGSGTNRVDTVYIDNAADAHLSAADRLEPSGPVAGKVYFIAQGEPILLWEMVDRILQAGDLPPVRKSIPAGLAYAIGGILEGVYRIFHLPGEPRMTRFVAAEMATAHWFDLTAAKRDLQYVPQVSTEEGMRRLRDWLRENPVAVQLR